MNTSKLNDWLQIAASAGVIVGLLVVAYEIRVSNRIGLEQAHAASLERWDNVNEMGVAPDVADLFIRAYEGEALTRAETFALNNFLDMFLNSLNYDLRLIGTGSLQMSSGDFAGSIQFYFGSEHARRRWSVPGYRNTQPPHVVAAVDEALEAPNPRDVLLYLDYVRGVSERY